MAELRNAFWVSATATKEEANKIADAINRTLPSECHCFVITLMDSDMVAVAGGKRATERYQLLKAKADQV